MCMSCGCGKPNDQHGDQANIIYDQLEAAAKAANIDAEQAADNIHALAKQIRDQGMPVSS
jgi:hypothetical protein